MDESDPDPDWHDSARWPVAVAAGALLLVCAVAIIIAWLT